MMKFELKKKSSKTINNDKPKIIKAYPVFREESGVENEELRMKNGEEKMENVELGMKANEKPKRKFWDIFKKKDKSEIKEKKKPGMARKIIGGFFKILFITFLILILILIAVGLYGYNKYGKSLLLVKDSAEIAMNEAQAIKTDFYNRDTSKIEERFETIDEQLAIVETNLKVIEDFKDLQLIEGYYGNYEVGMTMIPKVRELLEISKPRVKTIMDILISEAVPTSTDATVIEGETAIEISPEATPTTEAIPTVQTNICTGNGDTYQMSGGADILFEGNQTDATSSDSNNNDSSSEETASTDDEDGKDSPFTIKGLVKSLPEVSKLYQEAEPIILALAGDFNKIDPDYFPEQIFGDIGSEIKQVQTVSTEFISEYETVSPQIKDTLEMLPVLLGSETPVTFLIVPQNEKEMRSSGGLLTAYGIVRVDKGEIVGDISTVDMWELENYLTWDLGVVPGYSNIYGQLALMEYGCGAYPLRAQDSGIYSDNYISMDMFKDYYDIAHEYDPNKYPSYDLIVTFNTFFISDLIRLVEPITMDDGNYLCASDAAKKIYYETSINPDDYGTRKSYIGKVGDVLQERITEMSTKDLLTLIQVVMSNVVAKHVSFYSKDTNMQAYFDEMGLTGRVVNNFDGDYFQLNEAQNCALKANFYIYDTVTQTINIADDGTVSKGINVEWVNEKVYDVAEEQMLTGSSSFLYRAWIRFYSPGGSSYWEKGSSGMLSTWFYYPEQYYDNTMQKETWDDVMWFDHRRNTPDYPIKRASYSIHQASPAIANYDDVDGYKLLIQKHPGKKAEKYILTINYKGQQYNTEFNLDRDKVVSFKDGVVAVENYPSNMDPMFDFIETVKGVEL